MEFLAHTNGMDDVYFTIKDVIYIVGILLGGAGTYYKLIREKDKLGARLVTLEKENSDIMERMIRKDEIVHKRIDKTQEDQKKYSEKIDGDIKELGGQFNELDKKVTEGFATVLAEIRNIKEKE